MSLSKNTEYNYVVDLLQRVMSEVRPYTRPSSVNYDMFPNMKEAQLYLDKQGGIKQKEESS